VWTWRRFVAALKRSDDSECAESCLEALCDPERHATHQLGEHEEAVIEAERRRWEGVRPV
jgi:hypothetical protein